jgi:hypothetical protein
MDIYVLHGTEKRLYDLIAPLVLSPAVLRQNRGVAFKTSSKHIWFVAVDGNQKCIGFLPVQFNNNIGKINNYYIKNRNEEIMTALLTQVLEYAKKFGYEAVDIIAQQEDYKTVQQLAFAEETQFVYYTRFRKPL